MTFRNLAAALFFTPLVLASCFLPAPAGLAPVSPQNGTVPVPAPTIAGTKPAAPPWFTPGNEALKYVESAGIDVMATEAFDYHIHSYLTVYWNGAQVPVPGNIGISNAGIWISPLHTHDQSGKVHVEAPARMHLTLQQFFTTWNVSLGTAMVYENGKPVADGKNLVFQDAQTVAVVFGQPPGLIPDTYPFDDAGAGFVGQSMPPLTPSSALPSASSAP